MFAKVLTTLLGLSAVSWAQLDVDLGDIIHKGEKFDITNDVQGLLPQMNEFVEVKNMANVELPDVTCRKQKSPIFTGVTFEGLDKMSKALRGEVTVLGPDSIKVCTSIVWENPKLSVEKSSETNSDLSWDIGSLTMDLHFFMLPQKTGTNSCYTKYYKLRISNMTDVVQHSSNADFDGKVPDQQNIDKVIRHYNLFLKNPKVLKKLSKTLNLCEPSSDRITSAINAQLSTQ